MNFLKHHILIIIIAAVASIGIISYTVWGTSSNQQLGGEAVSRMTLAEEVSTIGKTQAAQTIDLAFEKAGKVSRVYADVGDKVDAGQTIVTLENSELAAQLLQVEANLESEEAKLSELERGAQPEEIQVQEVKVANAKTALEDAKRNLVDKLQDTYTQADDVVKNRVDIFFNDLKSSSPQLSFSVDDSQLEIDIEWQRLLMRDMFKSWRLSLDQLTTSSDLTAYFSEATINLNQIKSFLDKTAPAVNSLLPNSKLSQSTIDSWKAGVSAGRTNINAAVTNLSTAEEKLNTEKSDLALAEQELLLKKAGTVGEQIASQKAKVKAAQANVQNIQAQIAKTIIRSPINGIITLQNAKVGEIISANAIIVSLISEAKFEINSYVSEADVVKIKIGDLAKVSLDAYGSEIIFGAHVTKIDPVETTVNGIASYGITFQFDNADERIKSGMTANISIETAKRENALAVPERAVIIKDNNKFVLVVTDKSSPEERMIETGIKGSNGYVEILSGLKEGDRLVNFGAAQ